jgi:peptide-methionine (S)-S-oxide reductase
MDSRSGRLDTVHRFTAEPVVVGTGDRAGAITLAPSRFAIDVGMWRSPGTQRRGLERAERDIGRGDAYIRSIGFEKSVIAMRTKVVTGSFAPDFAGALTAVLLLLIGTIYWATSSSAETARIVPPPVVDETAPALSSEVAVLAGGCFWGVQGVFQHVDGVSAAVSGYTGGAHDTAQYHMVGTGTTGHAESVQITFDPRRISYGRILQIYFSVAHDPTELNHQGPDTGTQYRSTIFTQTPEQARIAKAYIAQLSQAGVFRAPIVTTIEPGKEFYPAEAYHQDYLTLHPSEPYIAINDIPKVEALARLFPDLYKSPPVLVAATQRAK